MRRVDAMFRESRNRVVIRRREGNVENSRGLMMYREVNKMTKETVILNERRMSRRKVGRGMIITRRMPMTLPPMRMSVCSIPKFGFKMVAVRSAFSITHPSRNGYSFFLLI
jgi:hypothetical protein